MIHSHTTQTDGRMHNSGITQLTVFHNLSSNSVEFLTIHHKVQIPSCTPDASQPIIIGLSVSHHNQLTAFTMHSYNSQINIILELSPQFGYIDIRTPQIIIPVFQPNCFLNLYFSKILFRVITSSLINSDSLLISLIRR